MSGFKEAPNMKNYAGKERKFGFEFEFAGTSVEESASVVKCVFGGQIEKSNSLEFEIKDTDIGTFKVELDSIFLKEAAEELENPPKKAYSEFKKKLSKFMGDSASGIVPCEIVTPPMHIKDFVKLEKLQEELIEKGAQGTEESFLNAFGMHINPEICSDKVDYIKDVTKAFLVLYSWLKKVMNVDITRRILSYIDPFPKEYLNLILQAGYSPDLDDFIADYLKHNPTRNRALDLLPLFRHIKPDSLEDFSEEILKLVKARPTFHYRLANCEFGSRSWSIKRDWNYWLEVEKLAEDTSKLNKISADYLSFINDPLNIMEDGWIKILSQDYGYGEIKANKNN